MTILNAAQNAAVVAAMNAAGVTHAWIGLNDIAADGSYVWSRSDFDIPLTSSSYTNWAGSQPAESEAYTDCGDLQASNSKWRVRSCVDQDKPSVCHGIAPPPSPPPPSPP